MNRDLTLPNFTNAWLYVTAPIAGAMVAALIHKVLNLLAEDRRDAAHHIALKLGDDPEQTLVSPIGMAREQRRPGPRRYLKRKHNGGALS